jgi:hypothetical protein
LKKPRIYEVILLLENVFKEFRILHDFVEIKALSPKPEVLASITKKLSKLRDEAQGYLVENGSAVPKLPLWGKNNDPEEWLQCTGTTFHTTLIFLSCASHSYIFV